MPSSQSKSYYFLRNLIRKHDRALKYRPIPDGPPSAYLPPDPSSNPPIKPLDLTGYRRKHNPFWAVKSSLNVAGLAMQQQWINNRLWDAADRGDPVANARLYNEFDDSNSWYNNIGLYAGATASSIGQFARTHPYTTAAAIGAAAFSAYMNNPGFDPKNIGRFYESNIRPYLPRVASTADAPMPTQPKPVIPSDTQPNPRIPVSEDAGRYISGKGSYYYRNAGGGYRSKIASFNPPPVFNNSRSNGAVIMSHREYLGDVYSSPTPGQFQISQFPLNPGNEQTFPWLHRLAVNFQEYTLLGVLFEYRSMSADALTGGNTALGSVIMATNYNAAAAPFTSKVEMENTEFAQSIKPSASIMHPIECSPKQTAISTTLYVRPSNKQLVNEDIRLYDWGNFFIATTGFQGSDVNCGELWVTYQVALRKPLLLVTQGVQAGYMHVFCYDVAQTYCFGVQQYVRKDTLYPKVTIGHFGGTGPNTITFPPTAVTRKYFVEIILTTPAGHGPTFTGALVGTAISFIPVFGPTGARVGEVQKGNVLTTSTGVTYNTAIQVLPSQSSSLLNLTFSSGFPGTSTQCTTEIFIIEDPDLG